MTRYILALIYIVTHPVEHELKSRIAFAAKASFRIGAFLAWGNGKGTFVYVDACSFVIHLKARITFTLVHAVSFYAICHSTAFRLTFVHLCEGETQVTLYKHLLHSDVPTENSAPSYR